MRLWVKHNKLEDMTDLLIYDLNDLAPSGTLCHNKDKAESEKTIMVPMTPMKELYNLYRYIQHLRLTSEYDYDYDEFNNPLDDRTKKSNIAERGHTFKTTFTPNNDGFINQLPSETPDRDPYMAIDTPSDEFYTINTNQSCPPMSARHELQPRLLRSNPNTKPNTFPKKPARQKWTCPIYLPGHIYKLLSQEAKDALQKYNLEAIQKFESSRNLHETNFTHDVHEHTQDNIPSSTEEDEFQECQEFNTDQDLAPRTDDLLDLIRPCPNHDFGMHSQNSYPQFSDMWVLHGYHIEYLHISEYVFVITLGYLAS